MPKLDQWQLTIKPWMKHFPNYLTLARIVVIPVLLIFYPLFQNVVSVRIFMGFLFGGASLTDLLDGYIARKFKVESRLGAVLDPIADKLLSATGLLLIGAFGKIPVFIAGLLLIRDIAIHGLRTLALQEHFDLEVNIFGKYKTSFQLFGISLLLGDYPLWGLPIRELGIGMIWIALLLSYYSAYTYGKEYYHHMSEANKMT